MIDGSAEPWIFGEKQIVSRILKIKSDWTKPLDGGLAFELFVMRELLFCLLPRMFTTLLCFLDKD
jgi:hypothetical protein